jgi:chemotaxis protein methyltransferase CheR
MIGGQKMLHIEAENRSLVLKQLSDEEFEMLRGVVYRETGIKLSDLKRSLLQSRLLRRLRSLGLHEFSVYIEYLRDNYNDEIINFINAITTNKTEFFRENQHFDYLTDIVFAEIKKTKKNRIRIWSAGCSTGEEAYSIAITASEYFNNQIPDLKILATDIDTQVLEKGYSGIYSFDQISGIHSNLIKKYFAKGKDENEGVFKIKDSLKNLIVFKRLNLLDQMYPMKGKFDIIFCRNVVIYFDKATQKKLFERFYDYLSDDGYLFVGHSENLSGITDKFRHLGKTVYKKVIVHEENNNEKIR